MPWRALSSRRNSAATRGSWSIRPRRSISPIRLRTGCPTTLPNDRLGHLDARLERDRRVGEHAPDPLVGGDRRGGVELGPPRLDRVVTLGDLEGGLGVAARGRVAAGHQAARHQLFGPPTPDVRQELLDEPALALVGHRLADDLAGGEQREVGDLGPDVGDRAGLLGLDLGGGPDAHALELLAGRGDVRVARLLGDLLGTGQDVVRLAARLAERGDSRSASAFSRSRRACSASLRPCSIRDLAVGEHAPRPA